VFRKKKKLDKSTAPKKTNKFVAILKKPLKPLVSFGGYFKGSWIELRQVRWPDRKATWSMTLAVLLFTAFFVVLIVLLDAGFKFLFDKIILK
jgi:preprotein translocase SecE subunit